MCDVEGRPEIICPMLIWVNDWVSKNHGTCFNKARWRLFMKKLSVLGIIGGAALLTAAPCSLEWSQKTMTLSLDTAHARVARRG